MEETQTRPLLTVGEIAEATRFSPNTIRRAIKAGRLRAVRMGEREWRVTPEACDAWIARGMPTLPETPYADTSN